MIKITPTEFALFSKYILEISGIALVKGKEYLVETRLHPLLEELGCLSYTDFYQKSQTDSKKNLEKRIVDAISTNETYFFRDKHPFDLLQHKIIPDLVDKRTKNGKKWGNKLPIRIWSAASSTGQEIYSIAMVLKELGMDLGTYDIKLLGTDISDAAVAQASYGRYNKFESARGLSSHRLQRFFNRDGENWRVKDEIRAMAIFRRMNLIDSFTGIGKFDIILCRNVAIYFTAQDRKLLYQKIAGSLEPDGYLLIGSTESLSNETALFQPQKYLNSIFYQFKTHS